MAWILILVLAGSHGGSVTTQDFDSEQACEAAGIAAKELDSFVTSIRYTCVRR